MSMSLFKDVGSSMTFNSLQTMNEEMKYLSKVKISFYSDTDQNVIFRGQLHFLLYSHDHVMG